MDDLELPRSRLYLADGVLCKLSENDVAIGRFPLDKIRDIRLETSRDYALPLILFGVFSGLAMVAKQFISSPALAWSAAIVCVGIAVFALITIDGRKVVIETNDGVVGYPVSDGWEDAEGFVITVRQHLK